MNSLQEAIENIGCVRLIRADIDLAADIEELKLIAPRIEDTGAVFLWDKLLDRYNELNNCQAVSSH